MSFEIRPAHRDELIDFLRPANVAFGWQTEVEEQDTLADAIEFDRTLAAIDDSRIVGSAAAYSFQLTLPGLTTTPAAGVTLVAVFPTHTRQGILTAFMRQQLADVRARNEPVAILYASESSIYGRFGYGPSTTQIEWTIDRKFGRFLQPPQDTGHLTVIDAAEAASQLPHTYERARHRYPGAVTRGDVWWTAWLRDPTEQRDNASFRMYAIHTAPSGETDGYVAYRIGESWRDGSAGNTLIVTELMPGTREAYAALWNYCFNMDLVGTIRAVNRPPDDPVRWMIVDSRRLRMSRSTDGLWTRLVDIPAALEARRYQSEDTLVFEILDAFMPDNTGRYHLEGGPDGAICRRVRTTPDLVLDVSDLGAAYLGNVQVSLLHRAGRVEERTEGAAMRADAMFASSPAPWCSTHF